MSKYLILVLSILFISSCKSPQQKAYEIALSSGVQLIENDTINVTVDDKLLYVYKFSAGVEDIHYTLTYVNSDPTVLQYDKKEEFYLGAQDVDGGPSAGLHIFKAIKEGFVKLDFYNPYHNEEKNKADAVESSIDKTTLIQQFCEALNYPVVDNNWNVQTLQQPTEAWLAAATSVERTMDSLMKIHAVKHVYHEDLMPVLDSLYSLNWMNKSEEWRNLKTAATANTVLNKETVLTTCYIRVATK